MEPHAVKCISSIFSKGDAFVGTIITVDDSTMRNRPKQNGREMVEAGVVSCVTLEEDLPKTNPTWTYLHLSAKQVAANHCVHEWNGVTYADHDRVASFFNHNSEIPQES